MAQTIPRKKNDGYNTTIGGTPPVPDARTSGTPAMHPDLSHLDTNALNQVADSATMRADAYEQQTATINDRRSLLRGGRLDSAKFDPQRGHTIMQPGTHEQLPVHPSLGMGGDAGRSTKTIRGSHKVEGRSTDTTFTGRMDPVSQDAITVADEYWAEGESAVDTITGKKESLGMSKREVQDYMKQQRAIGRTGFTYQQAKAELTKNQSQQRSIQRREAADAAKVDKAHQRSLELVAAGKPVEKATTGLKPEQRLRFYQESIDGVAAELNAVDDLTGEPKHSGVGRAMRIRRHNEMVRALNKQYPDLNYPEWPEEGAPESKPEDQIVPVPDSSSIPRRFPGEGEVAKPISRGKKPTGKKPTGKKPPPSSIPDGYEVRYKDKKTGKKVHARWDKKRGGFFPVKGGADAKKK